MNLLIINSVIGIGSTGKICLDIAKRYEGDGYNVKIAYGRKQAVPEECRKYAVRIGNNFDNYEHVLLTRTTDRHGLGSVAATKRFLKWADEFKPDMLWLHNIHGYYINYELLFKWIKSRPDMKVRWTLHDCWAFTGHCSHFTYVKCNKWETGCKDCPQTGEYPRSEMVDYSAGNYARKKEAFLGVPNLEIIVPSAWLKNRVSDSFLGGYPIIINRNRIDTNEFKPTDSNFRKEYGLEHKKVVLGVASAWGQRKGLNDFIELAGLLDDSYRIVLVGLKHEQMKNLPDNILGLPVTRNARELAKIYTAADVFVNPSYEETFGMTTMEAQACGTYTIVYRGTACEEVSVGKMGCAISPGAESILDELNRRFGRYD